MKNQSDLVAKIKKDAEQRQRELGKTHGEDPYGKFSIRGCSRDELGRLAKVSGKQYEKGIRIKYNNPEMWNKCLQGELSIDIVDKLFGLKEKKEAKERQQEHGGTAPGKPKDTSGKFSLSVQSRDKLGRLAKVSGKQYEKGIKIKYNNPEIWNKCLQGELSIDGAYKKIKNEEVQSKIDKQKEEIKKGLKEPDGLFDIIVVDPPWKYDRKYDAETSRVASQYPEMDFNELMMLDLHAAEDCILWLWTTHQFIWDAKKLMESWGFEYKAMMIWDKEKLGMGKYLRLQCEFCLIGFKGKPLWDKKNIRDIIREPRTRHSVKPEGFYKMIDDNFIGRKLDYFGRKKREGWEIYGAGQNSISE